MRSALIVLLAAAAGPALAQSDHVPDLANGRKLADLHCSRCHAVGQTDESLMTGAPPFRELKKRYPLEDLAESLAEGIMTSHPQMPMFTFSADEIDDLLAYMNSLQ